MNIKDKVSSFFSSLFNKQHSSSFSLNQSTEEQQTKYTKQTRLTVSLAAIGLIIFLGLAVMLPFKDKLLSTLYPKPQSKAQTIESSYSNSKMGAVQVLALGSESYTGTSYVLSPAVNTEEGRFSKLIQSKIPSYKQKGYIIEFQSRSVAEQNKEQEKQGKAIAGTRKEAEYKKQLEAEHTLAKADILSKAQTGVTSSEKAAKIIGEFFNVFNGLAIDASVKQIESIKSSKYVKKISPNLEVKPLLDESVTLIGAPTVWATTNSAGQKITGKGVKIGIIDTGIDYQHPDLGGCFGNGCKVIDGYDFADGDNDPMDTLGHGTHVAAIAAGNGTKKGVAPEASLVAYKVFNSAGLAYGNDILAALDRSVDPNQDGLSTDHLDVINLSLGADCLGGYSPYCGPDDPISIAVNNAVWRNIVVVVAAGNSGPSEKTIGSPAVASQAIAVGASSKTDQIADFSSRGPVIIRWPSGLMVGYIKPDIVAPGVNICAAKAAITNFSSICGDSNHILLSGTSMATPHVAGAAALIKQTYPNLPSTSYKNVLKSSANLLTLNPLLEGGGRINLPAAINQANGNPPLAALDPIALGGVTRNIVGLITSQNLKEWSLSFNPINDATTNWTQLQQGSIFPQPYLQYSLNINNVPHGIFKVRLQSEDNDGRKSREYGYLEVIKYKITAPQNSDIYRVGDLVPISISFEEGVAPRNITIEYKREGGSYSQIYSGQEKNSTWNTANLDTGLYYLRFTVDIDGTISQQEIQLYLDSSLKAGWPKNLNYEINPVENRYWWIGEMETSVDDLDGDGKSEIIFQTAGFPPKLWVYNSDGTIRWSKEIRVADANNPGNLNMVLVIDLNNDGKKEILLQNFQFGKTVNNTEIQSYDYQGNSVPGWPVKVDSYYTRLIAADINNDGSEEIVARTFGFTERLIILSKSGQIINQWVLPRDNLSSSVESSPTVGNFDSDPELEIVVATPSLRASEFPNGFGNEGLLYVYNRDGTVVPGWPATFPGLVEASPVVGDLNKDGSEEIVLAISYTSNIFPDLNYGGLYVYDKSGQLLPGWPKGRGYNYWSTPALGDLDKDGNLEIIASRLGESTEVYKYDGSMLTGWPQNTRYDSFWYGNNYYSDITTDINGDGDLDVISRAGFRIFAWNRSGEPIPGFPKVLQGGITPPTIKDIDNNGKAEIVSSADNDIDLINLKSKLRGAIYVWEMPNNFRSDLISWPTFKQNELRTGRYPPITSGAGSGGGGGATTTRAAFSTVYPSSTTTQATTGTFDIFVTGATATDMIWFGAWTLTNQVDDLVWYQGQNQEGGRWVGKIDLSKHTGIDTIFVRACATNKAFPQINADTICRDTSFQRVP